MTRAKKVEAEVEKSIEEVITERVIDTTKSTELALASVGGQIISSNFYMPNSVDQLGQIAGIIPDKLMVPREYHAVINMCYDFYQRGGIVGTVIDRLTELSMTTVTNGQRDTTDEANEYFDAVLHRRPSRLSRFLKTAALEYYLSGMVLPRIDWIEVPGNELSPNLRGGRNYWVPTVDLWPPKLIKVEWAEWGNKNYYIEVPDKDIRIMMRGDSNKIKEQQRKFRMWKEQYPELVQAVQDGAKYIKIDDVDAILRKESSFTEYPTPYLFGALEALIYKQQLRRMDYAVASRVINAILLVTEGSDAFPITEETRGNLDNLKRQIEYYSRNPAASQRLFPLFSNHTTKLQWIAPDVTAMLDQEKYRQVNTEIAESLGLAQILITGESRNAQASEVSTWAIQPMMEELREMVLEWLITVYEEGSRRNGFRKTPIPTFAPIRLQDFIKTAAVFAQAFKEGNISRTTRDVMLGIDFESEVELMKDEKDMISGAKFGSFPEMPYNIQLPQGGGGIGRPPATPNKGGRPLGSQNPPINNRNRGVKPPGQDPVSRVAAEISPMSDLDFFDLADKLMSESGIVLTKDNL